QAMRYGPYHHGVPLWLDFREGHALHFQTMQGLLNDFLQPLVRGLSEQLLQEQGAASQGDVCQGLHKDERLTPAGSRTDSPQHCQGQVRVLHTQFASHLDPQVEWELGQCLRPGGGERIVFIQWRGVSGAQLVEKLCRLHQPVPVGWLNRSMRLLLHLYGTGPRGQWQGRATAPLLQQTCQIRRWVRFQERQDHLLLCCGETGKAVLQESTQLRVFLTQAVESGPGLVWHATEVDTGLCQGANPR